MTRRTLRHLAIGSGFIALACGGGVGVDLAPLSTVDSLVIAFRSTDNRGRALSQVSFVSVRRCSREGHAVYWLLRRSPGSVDPLPARLEYGRAPAGWVVDAAAKPFVSGCYELSVDGSDGVRGGMTFIVDSAGRVARE